MSKVQFFEMREQEIAEMYASDFTKTQAQATGINLVKSVIENGEVDKLQFTANLERLNEVVSSAMAEMRNHIPSEKTTVFGVEFVPTNGGNTVNYAEDEIWSNIKADLDARTEQLKLAQKQDTFDAYGNQVPKVSTTPRKDSISIKF